MKSINAEDSSRCVDIFLRPDGTYGLEEFRRKAEDNRGWFPVGFYGDVVFGTEDEALNVATSVVVWLDPAIPPH